MSVLATASLAWEHSKRWHRGPLRAPTRSHFCPFGPIRYSHSRFTKEGREPQRDKMACTQQGVAEWGKTPDPQATPPPRSFPPQHGLLEVEICGKSWSWEWGKRCRQKERGKYRGERSKILKRKKAPEGSACPNQNALSVPVFSLRGPGRLT